MRPSWAASFRSVIHGALNAYCDLYGSEAKVLQGVLTCTAEPWWWDRVEVLASVLDVVCSGPLGCRVLESVAEDQRRLWSARRRDTMNAARTAAIRQLRREGWAASGWPTLLVWVMEDQSRGVPHLHFVLGHTTALEKAFARAFFRALKSAAYAHGLGHTSTYERAVLEQGKYEAGRLRHYVSKLAGYLSKGEGASAFLLRHSGERIFYVAPWLSRLSGVTMTIARLWSARVGRAEGLLCDANDDRRPGAARLSASRPGCAALRMRRGSARPPAAPPRGRAGLGATRERSDRGGWAIRRARGRAADHGRLARWCGVNSGSQS